MKLHLPKSFRMALLASLSAVAAVALTLGSTSFAAENSLSFTIATQKQQSGRFPILTLTNNHVIKSQDGIYVGYVSNGADDPDGCKELSDKDNLIYNATEAGKESSYFGKDKSSQNFGASGGLLDGVVTYTHTTGSNANHAVTWTDKENGNGNSVTYTVNFGAMVGLPTTPTLSNIITGISGLSIGRDMSLTVGAVTLQDKQDAPNTIDGTLTVTESLTLTAGSSLTLSNTIINSGSVTLAGTVTVCLNDSMAITTVAAQKTNGFLSKSYEVISGGTIDAGKATWIWKNVEADGTITDVTWDGKFVDGVVVTDELSDIYGIVEDNSTITEAIVAEASSYIVAEGITATIKGETGNVNMLDIGVGSTLNLGAGAEGITITSSLDSLENRGCTLNLTLGQYNFTGGLSVKSGTTLGVGTPGGAEPVEVELRYEGNKSNELLVFGTLDIHENSTLTIKNGRTVIKDGGILQFADGSKVILDTGAAANNLWMAGTLVVKSGASATWSAGNKDFHFAHNATTPSKIQLKEGSTLTLELGTGYFNTARTDAVIELAKDSTLKISSTRNNCNFGKIVCAESAKLELDLPQLTLKEGFTGTVVINRSQKTDETRLVVSKGDLGNIRVEKGILAIAGGIKTAGLTVSLKADTTLKTPLTLNGGVLELDGVVEDSTASEAAADLDGNTLTFLTARKTTLNLNLLDNVKTGSVIVLLNNVADLALAEDDTLGRYFELSSLTLASTAESVLLADDSTELEHLVEDLKERLAYSTLTYEDNQLKVTVAESILSSETLYWDADASGHWSGASWVASEVDLGVLEPGKMQSPWTGETAPSAFFTQDGSNSVSVDMEATVYDMSISSGEYTFVKSGEGSLNVQNKLTVNDGCTARFDGAAQGFVSLGHVTLAGSTASVVLDGVTTITGTVDASQGGTISYSGTTDLNLKGAKLGGTQATILTGSGHVTYVDTIITGLVDNSDAALVMTGISTLDSESETINSVMTHTDRYCDADATEIVGTNNGYVTSTFVGKLFESTDPAQLQYEDWQYTDGTKAKLTIDENGICTFDGDLGTQYVAGDSDSAAVYNAANKELFDRATALVLDGGHIELVSDLSDKIKDSKGLYARQDGSVSIGKDVTLAQSHLNPDGFEVTLGGVGTYDLGDENSLKDGVAMDANTWKGVVSTAATNITDLRALGTVDSTVVLREVTAAANIQADSVGTVIASKAIALSGRNTFHNAIFENGLTMGDGVAVNVAGALTLGGDLTLSAVLGKVTAKSLTDTKLNVNLDEKLIRKIGDSGQMSVEGLLTLTDSSNASLTLNGQTPDMLNTGKYLSTLAWNSSHTSLQLMLTLNEDFVTQSIAPTSSNGTAGAELLQAAYAELDLQELPPDSDLAALFDSVDEGSLKDTEAAAVAGASIATLGMALSSDVERQLNAIRNRTTSMGVNESILNENMPYYNAWVNAEGNRSELDRDDSAAGYTLDSWGGTVGFDMDCSENLTVGMAITAMYGDIDSDGPDSLSGDMDTCYLSLFARYASRAWTHTFVGTIGTMEGSYERTVNAANGYETEADMEGMSFGLMYEIGYVVPLNAEGTSCLQPIFNVMLRHSTVDSYTEEGSDAGLDVGEQELTTLTIGVGTRLQSVVGENLYNRSSILEARILAKADLGDRSSEADVAFLDSDVSSNVESAELGAFGVEIGAGLNIPLGNDDGSIFVDASYEYRSGYSNMNATVGYRINF